MKQGVHQFDAINKFPKTYLVYPNMLHMTFYNCNILTYSIIISFAYVSPTFVCIWKFWHPALLRPCLLIYCTTVHNFLVFLMFMNMKNSRFGGKLTTQMGSMKRLVTSPTLCRCIYCLINKSFLNSQEPKKLHGIREQ